MESISKNRRKENLRFLSHTLVMFAVNVVPDLNDIVLLAD